MTVIHFNFMQTENIRIQTKCVVSCERLFTVVSVISRKRNISIERANRCESSCIFVQFGVNKKKVRKWKIIYQKR